MGDLRATRRPIDRNANGPAPSGLCRIEELILSEDPWVAERCRDRIRAALPLIGETLGPYGVRLVFLAGSAGLGEAVGWEGDSRRVLSDLDLGVVTYEPVPAPVRGALRAAFAALDSDRLGPEVGAGLYETTSLQRQVRTPGMADFLAAPTPIAGEARVLSRFPGAAPGAVPPWEAFRLLGNRGLELLSAPSPDSEPGRAVALYRMAKLAEGIGKAWLVGRGFYQVGREARLERLARADVPAEVREAVLPWSRFLARPSEGSLPAIDLAVLQRGLVTLFREHGYWAAGGGGPAAAFVRDPRTLRDRLREWRHDRGAGGWGHAFRQGFQGSPEVRRLGVGALYWLALPERPEPDWGERNVTAGEGDLPVSRPESARVWAGVRVLIGRDLPAGARAKERTREVLGLSVPGSVNEGGS